MTKHLKKRVKKWKMWAVHDKSMLLIKLFYTKREAKEWIETENIFQGFYPKRYEITQVKIEEL